MASLTVRNIPADVMQKLREAAAEGKRSLNAQVIHWLEEAARRLVRDQDWDQLLSDIRSGREAIRRRHGPGSDSAQIIRQMREERTAHLLGLMKDERGKTKRRSSR